MVVDSPRFTCPEKVYFLEVCRSLVTGPQTPSRNLLAGTRHSEALLQKKTYTYTILAAKDVLQNMVQSSSQFNLKGQRRFSCGLTNYILVIDRFKNFANSWRILDVDEDDNNDEDDKEKPT